MNYWPAESTGLDLTKSLFDYMEVSLPCSSPIFFSLMLLFSRKTGLPGVHTPPRSCIIFPVGGLYTTRYV